MTSLWRAFDRAPVTGHPFHASLKCDCHTLPLAIGKNDKCGGAEIGRSIVAGARYKESEREGNVRRDKSREKSREHKDITKSCANIKLFE